MAGHIDMTAQWVAHRFYFRATVDGTQLSLQEVTGLETSNKVIDYRHGDSETFSVQKRLGITEFVDLELTKGVFEDDDHFLEIFNKVYDKEYMSTTDGRMDILVELLNELGDAIMVWNFHNCIPTKIGGVTLKSDASEAAVEKLTFVHEGVTLSL